jgi:N-acetylglucosaminyldiphosphoundecaprenol N-acetyl-beta-D-mannosaminyltransferase
MEWIHPHPLTVTPVMGIPTSRLTRAQLLECFARALDSQGPLHFAYLNIAVSNQAADNPRLEAILRKAQVVYVDGAGVALGLRLLGVDCPARNTGADFYREVAGLCRDKGKSLGLLGGHPGSAERLAEMLRTEFPGLDIPFIADGFQGPEDPATLERLRQNPPDLLLVGMGVPKQEEWIEKSRRNFGVTLYWSVGALFEYDAGRLNRCPDWMGRAGLEWLYRLYCEPFRLWKRYLIGNPRFLLRCLCSRWRGRAGTS